MSANKPRGDMQSRLSHITATTIIWACVSPPSTPSFKELYLPKVGHVLNPKGKHSRAQLPWRQLDDAVWRGRWLQKVALRYLEF